MIENIFAEQTVLSLAGLVSLREGHYQSPNLQIFLHLKPAQEIGISISAN